MNLTWFVTVIVAIAASCLAFLLATEWTARRLRQPNAGWRMINEREEFAPVLDWLEWWQRRR